MTLEQLDRITQAIEAIADIYNESFDDVLEALSDYEFIPYPDVVAIRNHRTS
jgi:hypothetical protein